MRVGIYIGKVQDPKQGGGATFQTSIIEALKENSSKHAFFILYDSPEKLFSDSKNVTFINMDISKPRPNFQNLFGLKKSPQRHFLNEKVFECKIDMVWSIVPFCPYVEVPYALTVWDLQHRLQPYFPEVSLTGWDFDSREKHYSDLIKKASYVVIGNNEGASQINEFYSVPLSRIKTIAMPTPNFVFEKSADDSVLKEFNLLKNNYLFYPAQFWPHKNHVRILKALHLLKSEGFNLKVAFSGSDKGNLEYVKEKAKELGLTEQVEFLGFISEEKLIALYKNALALTFASMFGPDNIPPLEAMALKCPVICSNAPGMEEQLADCALFFNSVDEFELAQRVKEILNNTEVKQNLTDKGYVLANNCRTSNYVSKIIEAIDEFAPIRECWSSREKYIHT